ncbi:PREDICTED: EP300-interacting inhibitor of differentiation 3 [Rhagoletis zephyria]|uniref:EP300-interacting inhibitor of differentiation 3 n=1 Tax=Rhagoletis zephyria TaxID=28612 RepID=UPI0008119492|nr:PREDICTED: EP300-interacting inhibitor of differentiation 3 [Rhagoletis zephyria]XP_036344534.1 EP300-interacting inhibitor of differentiation 3-like [Rhagoletis pomonella]
MNNSSDELNATQALDRKQRLKDLMETNRAIQTRLTVQSVEDTLNELSNVVKRSDLIHGEGSVTDRAEHTSEVMRDVQLLKMNHELMSKVFQQSSLMGSFSEQIYQNAIRQTVATQGDDDWKPFTEIACSIARMARAKSTMLGAYKVEVKERIVKERQQRKKAEQAEEKRPERVDKLQRQDKGAKKLNIVHKQLVRMFKSNGGQPIPYYQLIIDPKNFMNTVENAFQIAFLVRDNCLAIETGEDNYPHVRLVRSEEVNTVKETTQAICTLNVEKCREMIVFYEIQHPLLVIENSEGE